MPDLTNPLVALAFTSASEAWDAEPNQERKRIAALAAAASVLQKAGYDLGVKEFSETLVSSLPDEKKTAWSKYNG